MMTDTTDDNSNLFIVSLVITITQNAKISYKNRYDYWVVLRLQNARKNYENNYQDFEKLPN